jgi:peptidase M23-like protein
MHPLPSSAARHLGASGSRRRFAPPVLLVRQVPLVCAVVVATTLLAPSPAATAATGATTATAAKAAAVDTVPAHGVWPLQPRPPVVARFDPPATPWGRGHRGVDLAGHVGQQVHAAASGVVTYAGRLAGRGVVVVDHGSTRTTYEPVTATVQVGDRVAAGAVIGLLQLFGSHCFPRACLHWGLVEGRDQYLDPLTLVGAATVRLLPLVAASSSVHRLPQETSPVSMPLLTPWPLLVPPPSPGPPGAFVLTRPTERVDASGH